ncbi:unnamed protein product [Leptidea sinapis]|uniref:Uncharacterized protein n=1 Tax=Leptidea sinapis TaxID=189913 RepID=A0A5E4QTP4_9NEOP|nr:unnamed protein product [Leptidea sinapis]
MGDGLRITKDKRHRSSSSLAGCNVEGTRSERKLEITGPIPEVEDQFAFAEAQCDDLKEKLDLVKNLRRRRKLKKRSMTKIGDQPANVETAENVAFISVRTQPKKRLMVTEMSQQAARYRRLEPPANPTRGYLDPATVEQHQMLGRVRGYNQSFHRPMKEQGKSANMRSERSHAEGDAIYRSSNVADEAGSQEVACGGDIEDEYSDNERFTDLRPGSIVINKKRAAEKKPTPTITRKKGINLAKEGNDPRGRQDPARHTPSPVNRRSSGKQQNVGAACAQPEERPILELFNKNRASPQPDTKQRKSQQRISSPNLRDNNDIQLGREMWLDDDKTGPLEDLTSTEVKKEKLERRQARRLKYRSRHYELPTVASQMKQAGVKCYYTGGPHTSIPFIVSKSTAPSHNIGLNIQQVLNGLKIQQPLSGIPLTIAHHMGLGHVPMYGTKCSQLNPDMREMNAIKVGHRLLRLPSYKYISYNRLLNLYREGNGMVPRFLRAISRPHYFYTSMYNLARNRDDIDNATSKGLGGCQEAKQSLAEYASLYKEYEKLEKCLRENYDPDLERRKEELERQLMAREDYIRKVVQDYRNSAEDETPLRASASNAEDVYRQSTFKLNHDDR